MLFKQELGHFVFSIRSTGNLFNVINEALAAGLHEGLLNLGIFHKSDQPFSLRLGHDPIHWERHFGTDIVGANAQVRLENRIRIWISKYERSMEVVIDNSISSSACAWIKNFDLFEAGIEFVSRALSSSVTTPPDLKTTLTEWQFDMPPPGSRVDYVQALWRVFDILDAINQSKAIFPFIQGYGNHGHLVVTAFCNVSESIGRTFKESNEFDLFEDFETRTQRLQELSSFSVNDSGDVIATMLSARRIMKDFRSALYNTSFLLNFQVSGIQNNLEKNFQNLGESLQQEPQSMTTFAKISNNLLLETDILALRNELSVLNSLSQRASILVRSRYWGANVQDSFLEPISDHFQTRHRKPSLWTGNCLDKWEIRSHYTFIHNISLLSNNQCKALGIISPRQLQCCKQAVSCYASCHYSKSLCDLGYQNCTGDSLHQLLDQSQGDDILRLHPPWKVFSVVRRSFCICQKDPVRPSKVSGRCPAYFTKIGTHTCCANAGHDVASNPELAQERSNSSRLSWKHAATILMEHLAGRSDATSSHVRETLANFIDLLNTDTDITATDSHSFIRSMNVTRELSIVLKNALLNESSDDQFLMFGMSRTPRPSQDGIHISNSLLESSMSLLLWHSQESHSVLLLRESFAIIDEIHDGIKQASFLSDADSMMKFRKLMASALDEETSILESAQGIKRLFLDRAAATDIQKQIKLDAIINTGQKAKAQHQNLLNAWPTVKTSDLNEMMNILHMLSQREEILLLLKQSLSPGGA
jgi:hypothetical protein